MAEYLREAAFDALDDELPYAFAAEVDEFDEYRRTSVHSSNDACRAGSQKGIVIGRGRRLTLRRIGTHARARLEALLGEKVYLETWVKVLPRWRRTCPTAWRGSDSLFLVEGGAPMPLQPEDCSTFSSVPGARAILVPRSAPVEALVCHACRLVYLVEDDIPIMLIDEARSHWTDPSTEPSCNSPRCRSRPGALLVLVVHRLRASLPCLAPRR